MPKRNNPGCKCCTPKNCTTSVVITFYDLGGMQRFAYGAPGALSWTVIGSTTNGTAINLSGTSSVGGRPWTATFVFTGSQLPEGSYTLRIQSAPVCNGMRRFDCSYTIQVKCPKTTVTGACQAAFELISDVGTFSHDGCSPCDTDQMNIEASVPGTICSSTPVSCYAGSCSVSYKVAVTGFPATFTYTGSQPNYTTETFSRTFYADGTRTTSPIPVTDVLHSTQQPIQICSYCDESYAFASGTVEVSGRYNGSGTPDGSCDETVYDQQYHYGNVGKMDITNDLTATSATITIKHDKFNDRIRGPLPAPSPYPSYRNACWSSIYGPTGGITGPPIWGQYACSVCPEPLKWQLTANIFGQQVTLTCSNKQDPSYPTQALGKSNVWEGRFSVDVASVTCPSDPSQVQWDEAGGPVEFYAYFNGAQQSNGQNIPGLAVYYRQYLNGLPWQCSSGGSTPISAPGVWAGALSAPPGYSDPTGGIACFPFMAYRTGQLYYGPFDFRGVTYGPYYYDLNFSVSE